MIRNMIKFIIVLSIGVMWSLIWKLAHIPFEIIVFFGLAYIIGEFFELNDK